MRSEDTMIGSQFAWAKLYVAATALACTEGLLVERVHRAYHHLSTLNQSNLKPAAFQRLKALREQFASTTSERDEEDGTVTLLPITQKQAAHIANEIVSMYDEAAKSWGLEAATAKIPGLDRA